MMSAAWMVYRQNPDNIERIAKGTKLSDVESSVVQQFMIDSCYSIDEFRAALKELGIVK